MAAQALTAFPATFLAPFVTFVLACALGLGEFSRPECAAQRSGRIFYCFTEVNGSKSNHARVSSSAVITLGIAHSTLLSPNTSLCTFRSVASRRLSCRSSRLQSPTILYPVGLRACGGSNFWPGHKTTLPSENANTISGWTFSLSAATTIRPGSNWSANSDGMTVVPDPRDRVTFAKQ